MPRQAQPITLTSIKAAGFPTKGIIKIADGTIGGLCLEIFENGKRYWRLRYRHEGRENRMSLGEFPEVSIQDAREKAMFVKANLRKGIPPEVRKKKSSLQKMMEAAGVEDDPGNVRFETLTRKWIDHIEGKWSEGKKKKNIARIENKLLPYFGNKAAIELTPPMILALCQATAKQVSAYMAHLVYSDISRILRFGVVMGVLPSDPSRDIRDALPPYRHKHFATITDPREVGKFLVVLDGYSRPGIRNAIKLLMLTMVRTGELRFAKWQEIDFEGKIWRIPAERMKSRQEHLVPLSRQALAILHDLKSVAVSDLLISGRARGRPISDNTINAALRYMGYTGDTLVGHGFRSMASTLLNELQYNPDHIERQLAHTDGNTVRAAYNRAAYLPERAKMLQDWADYLDKLREEALATR